jgi:hypothetical protein
MTPRVELLLGDAAEHFHGVSPITVPGYSK